MRRGERGRAGQILGREAAELGGKRDQGQPEDDCGGAQEPTPAGGYRDPGDDGVAQAGVA